MTENTEIELRQERMLHYTMSFIGGIFAIYSLLEHANVFGSAETSNMKLLVKDLLCWDLYHIFIRIGSLAVYAAGIILTIWMDKNSLEIQKRVCILIDCFAAFVLGILPENLHPVIALYPVAFAMSIQWCTFRGVRENPSATTFSTGNFRQLITLVFHYVTEKKQENLSRIKFYIITMLSFHAGVATMYLIWPYISKQRHQSIWLVILPLLFAFIQESLVTVKKGECELVVQNLECEDV